MGDKLGTRGTSPREGTPSNTGKQKGRQWEIIQSQTHHPTKGNKKGHKGRQDLGKADSHVGRQ